MATMKYRHVESWKDRTGSWRHYFRRGHGPRIALPGEPGSRDFQEAYDAALEAKIEVGKDRHATGTFAWLALAYFSSPNFRRQKQSSQDVTRRIIEGFVAKNGHRLVAQMSRAHVLKILGEKAETPAAANNLLKKLRALISFGMVEMRLKMDDPTIKIKKYREGEHHTWTDEQIAQFEEAFPLGTLARTAFALQLYTGQRRDDVRRMIWSDISGDMIRVTQQKGGAKLEIPIHPKLREALDKWPKRHVSILTGPRNKPYTVESYGNLMADAIGKPASQTSPAIGAGLPARCVLHGIRKAAARRLAEAGCSSKEIAAITGHQSLKEVERYTRAADQRKLARAAIRRLPHGNEG